MKKEAKRTKVLKPRIPQPKEDTLCPECWQRVYPYQRYVWAKSKSGRINFCHTDCYRKLCGNEES